MNAEKCLQILREIKDVAFATVENGLPQVRIIDVMLVENKKLYFCTARGKYFYNQLITNGNVAVTGLNKKYQMVRLKGRAKKLDDNKKWIDRIFESNPSMNAVYPDDSRYILEAFIIDNGSIEFFDLSIKPINRQYFTLGKVIEECKGFFISDKCIRCGKCTRSCPQQCIEIGVPYMIHQEHCLHCGLCAEICPVNCIVKKG